MNSANMRQLRDTDISLIELALCIARDKFKADGKAAWESEQLGLSVQFVSQAEHAEHLRQAFEDYPTVTLSAED